MPHGLLAKYDRPGIKGYRLGFPRIRERPAAQVKLPGPSHRNGQLVFKR